MYVTFCYTSTFSRLDSVDKFIARHLLLNNEGKKWVNPLDVPISPDGILATSLQIQDDEIFTIARLINCIQFKNVVAEDFLKILMGLPNLGNSTNLDILIVIPFTLCIHVCGS